MTGYAKSICIELMASEIGNLRSMLENERKHCEAVRQRVVELSDELLALKRASDPPFVINPGKP